LMRRKARTLLLQTSLPGMPFLDRYQLHAEGQQRTLSYCIGFRLGLLDFRLGLLGRFTGDLQI
jgi:hypothetical protein